MPSIDSTHIYANIDAARCARRISRGELADAVGIRRNIFKVRMSRRSGLTVDELYKILAVLDIDANSIMEYRDIEHRQSPHS